MAVPMAFPIESATIRDAMLAVERGSFNAALAMTEDDRLAGIVSDGDLRRALLAGHQLLDPVRPLVRTDPVTARESDSRSTVLDLMRARGIAQIPVIDADGRVVGVHLMRELIGRTPRPNVALVLAGGRGTRLQPLTQDVPKPMVTVAGRPILERLINHLVGYGISRIVLSVGHLAEVIEAHFGDGREFGCEIVYLRESPDRPLGTGGPLGRITEVLPDVTDPLLVLNGDLVTQFDVAAMLGHHARSGASITVASFTYGYEVPFGVLDLDGDGNVTGLAEKPTRQETVSAGIYVVSPEVVDWIPTDAFTPMTQVLTDVLRRGAQVSAWALDDDDWIDVGQLHELAKARGLA